MRSENLNPDQAALRELRTIPNIGKACAEDLFLLGIRRPADLKGRDPDDLYRQLCEKTGVVHDPCMWDTLASAVHYADTGERKKWWEFTPIRKARGGTSPT